MTGFLSARAPQELKPTEVTEVLLVQYNPVGAMSGDTELEAGAKSDFCTISPLSQNAETDYYNNNVWPVGPLEEDYNEDRYISFSVSGFVGRFTKLSYSMHAYISEPYTIARLYCSLRPEEDLLLVEEKERVTDFVFNLTCLPPSRSMDPVIFKLYFYGRRGDWADLTSTIIGGSGLCCSGCFLKETSREMEDKAIWLLAAWAFAQQSGLPPAGCPLVVLHRDLVSEIIWRCEAVAWDVPGDK
jgi:hypothetical protein